MKNSHRYLSQILLVILVIAGGALFFWQEVAYDYLHQQAELVEVTDILMAPAPLPSEELETTVINDTKFIVLKNNVTGFDYEQVCRNLMNLGEREISQLSASEYSQILTCAVGNASPFIAPTISGETP